MTIYNNELEQRLKETLSGYVFEPITETTTNNIKESILKTLPTDNCRIDVKTVYNSWSWFKKLWMNIFNRKQVRNAKVSIIADVYIQHNKI